MFGKCDDTQKGYTPNNWDNDSHEQEVIIRIHSKSNTENGDSLVNMVENMIENNLAIPCEDYNSILHPALSIMWQERAQHLIQKFYNKPKAGVFVEYATSSGGYKHHIIYKSKINGSIYGFYMSLNNDISTLFEVDSQFWNSFDIIEKPQSKL
jgi:hypothetical protein